MKTSKGFFADPRNRVGLAVLFCAAAGFLAWRFLASEGDASPAPVAELSPKEELLQLAQRLQNGPNVDIGRGHYDELLALLPATSAQTEDGRALRSQLAREFLRMGDVDSAIVILDEAVAAIQKDPQLEKTEVNLYRVRGLAHLRKAELENCIRRHNRDCCIAPLQGAGIHTVAEPARAAAEDYRRYLELTKNMPAGGAPPESIAVWRMASEWLMNIAYMAIGEYPDGVPAAYRIPTSAFASQDDIGQFVDIAPELGIDVFDNAGGAIIDDFDGDGRLDLVSSTLTPNGPMKAFRNRGDGTFEDVAAAWKLDQQMGGLHIAGADFDNDGDLDIVVPRGAWWLEDGKIRKSLLRNDGPEGFRDVTRTAGMAEMAAPTQAVAWADFDNDGWLDLYVGHESRVDVTIGAPSYPSELFHNNRDGTFTEIAVTAGVTNDRYAKGVTAGDYDNDGDMDIYVSNIGPNRLYRNNGDLTFTDVGPDLKVLEPKRSFACWFFDYNNDGNLDIWCNAYDASISDVAWSAMGKPHHATLPSLYQNNGDGTFKDVAIQAGVGKAWRPMGCSFGDFDNDGWLDIYLGTGEPLYEALAPNIALRNDHGKRFLDITKSAGLGHLQKGHEVVFADLDDDGDQDLFHQLGGLYPGDAFRNALFLNPGHHHHFVTIELAGVKSNRAGVGARVTVTAATPQGLRKIHRSAGSVSSFGQCPRRQEIGLENATAIESIEIWWPASGARQTFKNVPLDSFIRVTEDKPDFEVLPKTPIDLKSKAGVQIAGA